MRCMLWAGLGLLLSGCADGERVLLTFGGEPDPSAEALAYCALQEGCTERLGALGVVECAVYVDVEAETSRIFGCEAEYDAFWACVQVDAFCNEALLPTDWDEGPCLELSDAYFGCRQEGRP